MAAKKKTTKKQKASGGSGAARKPSASKALKRKASKPASAKANRKKPVAKKAAGKKVIKKATSRKVTKKAVGKKVTSKKVAGKGAGRKTAKKKTAARPSASSGSVARKKSSPIRTSAKKTAKKAPARKSPLKARAKSARSRPAAPPKPAPRRRLSTFKDALKIYESAVRLMHREDYGKARAEFDRLIAEYPNETELLDRANVLIQACDNRIEEQKAPGPKSVSEFYLLGVAEMNSGAFDEARGHLEQALKLLPEADHVLYALATLHAQCRERDKALDYLSRSIDRRMENRFLAGNDSDFDSLSDDPEFLKLLSTDR